MSDDMRDVLAEAMQVAWNDFCNDTGHYPDCFEWRGRKLYADFSRGNFAQMVVDRLVALRVPEPPSLDGLLGTCDWGYCNEEGDAWRWDVENGRWLTVCAAHRAPETDR